MPEKSLNPPEWLDPSGLEPLKPIIAFSEDIASPLEPSDGVEVPLLLDAVVGRVSACSVELQPAIPNAATTRICVMYFTYEPPESLLTN